MPELYAWTAPAAGIARVVGDHTWITSEPKVLNLAYSRDYWYCAGSWRPTTAGKPIGHQQADLRFARCIDTPNVPRNVYIGMPSADMAYLIDGVCHQIANRILAAATPRLTVAGVRGYTLSWARYGTYGHHDQDWRDLLVERCPQYQAALASNGGTGMEEETLKDVLGARLPDDDIDALDHAALEELVAEVRANHRRLSKEYSAGNMTPRDYVAAVNKQTADAASQLHKIVGTQTYIRLIGKKPDEPVYLVDPNLPAGPE